MSESPGRGEIRVLRKKQIAETVRGVVNNKADVRELETALHSLYGRQEKHAEHERSVMHELTRANVFMARMVRELQDAVLAQQNQISVLFAEVRQLKSSAGMEQDQARSAHNREISR